jgi:hypothetical protein
MPTADAFPAFRLLRRYAFLSKRRIVLAEPIWSDGKCVKTKSGEPVLIHQNRALTGRANCHVRAITALAIQDRCGRMSKQEMREEAERLIRETMAKKALVIKQGNTRIEAVCGKCGAPNRVSAEKGVSRVKFACKECGHKQETL